MTDKTVAKTMTWAEGLCALGSFGLTFMYLVRSQWGFSIFWLVISVSHWTLASLWYNRYEQVRRPHE